MASEEQVRRVLNILAESVVCGICETRLRYGDYECPHCGADVEEELRAWVKRLLEEMDHR